MLLGWLVAVPLGRPGAPPDYGSGWGMMPWAWGTMGAMMPLMMLGMLLFWAAAVLGLVALVRWAAGLPWGRSEDGPLEIVRGRYARGEITREEYERLRDDLTRTAQ